MIRLIASDVDGTLVGHDHSIKDEMIELIQKLTERGIIFVAASGRQYHNLESQFSKVKDDIYFAAENGNYLLYKNKEIYSNALGKSGISRLIDAARKLTDCEIILCGKKAAYMESDNDDFIKEAIKYYSSYELVDDLKNVDDDILKIAICDFNGSAENSNNVIQPLFGQEFQVVVSGKLWLDIMNIGANKGVAIQKIQERFNITPEETMVFGDYFNDVEMFSRAYYSYAMENALDDVKKHARFIAKSYEDDGVIEVIKEMVQGL